MGPHYECGSGGFCEATTLRFVRASMIRACLCNVTASPDRRSSGRRGATAPCGAPQGEAPLLAVPVMSGGDGVDDTALSFLVRRAVLKGGSGKAMLTPSVLPLRPLRRKLRRALMAELLGRERSELLLSTPCLELMALEPPSGGMIDA